MKASYRGGSTIGGNAIFSVLFSSTINYLVQLCRVICIVCCPFALIAITVQVANRTRTPPFPSSRFVPFALYRLYCIDAFVFSLLHALPLAREQQNVTMLHRMVQQLGTTRDNSELRGQCRCQLEVINELRGKIQAQVCSKNGVGRCSVRGEQRSRASRTPGIDSDKNAVFLLFSARKT